MIKERRKYRISDYKPEFREDLIDIIFDAYSEHPEYGESSNKSAKRYINWLKNHSTMFKVLLSGEKPVAFIVVDGNWVSSFTGENIGEIHELAVKKDFWGHGIGKMLMKMALKHIKKLGLKKAGLWVGENNREAIQFYEKLGFKIIGKYNQWLRMERSL